MLGARQLHLGGSSSVSGFGSLSDQLASISPNLNPLAQCSCRISSRLSTLRLNHPVVKLKRGGFISCHYSRGRFGPRSHHEAGHDYLEASVLVAETVKHYHLFRHGFREDNLEVSGHFLPSSHSEKDFRTDVSSLGMDFLRRFENPTVFLKISCDGDFLLPIVVGDFALERLIDSLREDASEDCSNDFQLASGLASEISYQVRMVKITESMGDTYFSRIYFSKAGQSGLFSIDARPSDAINVASRFKVPIYVNKRVVLADAIRFTFKTGRSHDTTPCYDVLLDSASECSDTLAEELDIVNNLKLAVEEERYHDAAMWRDKLLKLQKSDRD